MESYELVNAKDCFDDDNGGLIYGIHWLHDHQTVDAEWFRTEEERQRCLDQWYAEQNQFTPEQ
jgi:hypothetical protein